MALQEKDDFETTTSTVRFVDVPLTTQSGVLRVPPVHANQGDTLRWKVDNRTVSIWFPTAGVFPAPVLAARKSGDIDVTIPRTAKSGTYHYVIYCHDTDEFAECESHPKLIIPVPD